MTDGCFWLSNAVFQTTAVSGSNARNEDPRRINGVIHILRSGALD
ncbi:hypothetical protein LP7551_03872 [Roseibium album]|nr:hypothetical protein LP7551_03872 [Roseibium album]